MVEKPVKCPGEAWGGVGVGPGPSGEGLNEQSLFVQANSHRGLALGFPWVLSCLCSGTSDMIALGLSFPIL